MLHFVGRRGRQKQNPSWKLLVFLLSKSNDDFVPTAAEINRLQRCGFGYPESMLSQYDRHPVKSTIRLGTKEELEDEIVNFYPNINLRMSGFSFAKADQGCHLQILNPDTPSELKKSIGQGKLFLIPKRDLRIPTREQPTREQPTTEQPTREQPTTEQPTTEQPTTEPTAAEETDLVSLYERLKPTPSRVISLLKTENDRLRPEEERVMYFLKDFVYSLSSEDLARFLQFVTGSCVIPASGGITICFHHAQGLLRYPIGRTCGNVLSVPIEYDSLQEFKREFLRIIRNDESFRMFVN